jgi:hypothetical protein
MDTGIPIQPFRRRREPARRITREGERPRAAADDRAPGTAPTAQLARPPRTCLQVDFW